MTHTFTVTGSELAGDGPVSQKRWSSCKTKEKMYWQKEGSRGVKWVHVGEIERKTCICNASRGTHLGVSELIKFSRIRTSIILDKLRNPSVL